MRKLLIALLLHTSGANAGWFGPSDYRECVLAEMKGKPEYLLPTIRGLCNNKFPCAKPSSDELAECYTMTDTPKSIPDGYGGSITVITARDYCIDAAYKTAYVGGNRD
jgi:hypothetical protein